MMRIFKPSSPAAAPTAEQPSVQLEGLAKESADDGAGALGDSVDIAFDDDEPDADEPVAAQPVRAETQALTDADLEEVDSYVAPQKTVKKLAEFAVPSGEVLDIACGTGLCGMAFHDAGFLNLTGIDYSENMLALAQKRGVYGTLRQADLNERLPFDDNSFHAATIVGLSLHLPAESYHEIGRVLKPGGLIFYCGDEQAFDERGVRAVICQPPTGGVIELVEVVDPSKPFTKEVAEFLATNREGLFALVLSATDPQATRATLAGRTATFGT